MLIVGVRSCAVLVLVCLAICFVNSPAIGGQQFLRKAGRLPIGRAEQNGQNEPVASIAALSQYRIRVVWGGGEAKIWRGHFQLNDGLLQNPVPLGLEADAGAALQANANRLNVSSLKKSGFTGFDLDVKQAAGNQITISLTGDDGAPFQQVVDLSPLLSASTIKSSIQLELDDSGNRMEITRAPGDRIPVSITRSHLVFHPGERFEFDLKPFVVASKNGGVQMQVETIAIDSAKSLGSQQVQLSSENGLVDHQEPIGIKLPEQEGVFDIRLSIRPDSLARRLNLDRPSLTRTIQVVVVRSGELDEPLDSSSTGDPIVLWKEIYDTDQIRKQWLDRLPGMDQFRLASNKSDKLRNEGVTAKEIDGQVWTEFAAGGWQAVPLQVNELNKPHIVEIEYLDDGPISMGISVLQPDASGQIQPFGVDSGINIPKSSVVSHAPTTRRHRIFFWPQHKSPYLLFANRHKNRATKIGKIRVLAGPQRLASNDTETELDVPTRQLMAFYEKPLFAENFASNQTIDSSSGQSHHDWRTFMNGADRWTQYLKANGYTGAMIVVAGDGSSLYPSNRLNPTPRFDSGVFDSNGADPIRKDVVELLLRIFQREGLQLVPVLHFNQPLPKLEQSIAENPQQAVGLTLTDLRGANRYPEFQNSATSVSFYNPLDKRVQSECDAVIDEFLTRYQEHPALSGVGLLLSRDCLQVLPGQTWGVDPLTLRRFANEANIVRNTASEPGNAESTADQQKSRLDDGWMLNVLNSDKRKDWLSWRQLQIGQWLQQTQERVSKTGPHRKLFLLGSDMLRTQDAFSTLAPSLRRNADIVDALARVGFPADTVAGNSNIVFLRPFELAPEKSLANDRLNLQLRQTDATRNVLQSLAQGTLFTHRASWAEFQQLQKQKLFTDSQVQPVMRIQPLTPAGDWARQRFVEGLVHGDGQYLVDGGWLSTLGQEEHLSKLIESYTRLPAIPFQNLEDATANAEATSACGLVVRQANHQGRNYFYIANPTPWSLKPTIQLSGRNTVIESLGQDEFLFDENSEQPQFTVELQPFSIRAGYMADGVQIVACQAEPPDEVAGNLQDRLNSLLSKASQAAQAQPIEVLTNPDFEMIDSSSRNADPNSQSGQIAGWNFDTSLQRSISVNSSSAFSGQNSLRLISDGQATWIRSNPIEYPVTGRLSISVMIRTDRPEIQPPLRISIQGDDGRQVYYRYGTVGDQQRQVTGDWQEYAVHFDDLPMTDESGQGRLEIGFDLMGEGHVEIDNVRVFDRWLDQQDSRSLTQLLALAGFQLNSQRDPQRCRQILNGYWPRFLEEFFPDLPEPAESTANRAEENRSSR